MQEEIPLQTHFPSVEGDQNTLKDKVITTPPNIPHSTSNDLHETRTFKCCPGRHKIFRERSGHILLNAQEFPSLDLGVRLGARSRWICTNLQFIKK
jgi:hypothetical protein